MDATVGFININQNKIIKIFSVASVALLPPTLIASIYGMNFACPSWTPPGAKFCPGADAGHSVAAPFIYFRRRLVEVISRQCGSLPTFGAAGRARIELASRLRPVSSTACAGASCITSPTSRASARTSQPGSRSSRSASRRRRCRRPLDESFNLATWNIREFGKKPRTQYIHYIAEVLGQFDLIGSSSCATTCATCAVCSTCSALLARRLLRRRARPGGNRERVAYLYDDGGRSLNGMASAAFAHRSHQGTEWVPDFNWWRPPYVASFKSGSFDFVVVSTHIRWGDDEAGREPELAALAPVGGREAGALQQRQALLRRPGPLQMGDFNIPSPDSPLFQAITSTGLRLPTALAHRDLGSNLERNKRYDQILHLPHYP